MRELQTTSWTIDQPVPDEASSIASLMADGWRETYQRKGQPERNAQVMADADAYLLPERVAKRRRIIENLGDDEYMRVAKIEDDIVAWLYGFNEPERQELLALYVREAFHGRGIAHELVRGFFGWVDPSRPVEVGVADDNERAKRFYTKVGFGAIKASRPFNNYLTELVLERPPQNVIDSDFQERGANE